MRLWWVIGTSAGVCRDIAIQNVLIKHYEKNDVVSGLKASQIVTVPLHVQLMKRRRSVMKEWKYLEDERVLLEIILVICVNC